MVTTRAATLVVTTDHGLLCYRAYDLQHGRGLTGSISAMMYSQPAPPFSM